MERGFNEAKGLWKMYIAQLGVIICEGGAEFESCGMLYIIGFIAASAGCNVDIFTYIVMFLRIIGPVGTVVFTFISLKGLNEIGKDIAACEKAFTIALFGNIAKFFSYYTEESVLLFTLASIVLSFLVIYFVCTSVSKTLAGIGAYDIADSGKKVWKTCCVCTIIQLVAAILYLSPLGWYVWYVRYAGSVDAKFILELVWGIPYIIFLCKSYKALIK